MFHQFVTRISSLASFSHICNAPSPSPPHSYLSPFTVSGPPANPQTTAVFPADMFSVVWSGKLLAPSSEVTRFYLALCANVGARLQINGQLVVDAFRYSAAFCVGWPW